MVGQAKKSARWPITELKSQILSTIRNDVKNEALSIFKKPKKLIQKPKCFVMGENEFFDGKFNMC